VYYIQLGDLLDGVHRRLAEDYPDFCTDTSEAEVLVNKAYTMANTKKGKGNK
jgi:hypothetical protein